MAAVTEEQVELVRSLVASIPAGRVATYGDIADAAGLSSARIVGWIMRTDSADLPWHRVIGASAAPHRISGPVSSNCSGPRVCSPWMGESRYATSATASSSPGAAVTEAKRCTSRSTICGCTPSGCATPSAPHSARRC